MHLLLKFLKPLTWLLWGMIGIGMLDHFILGPRGLNFLPEGVLDWLIILLWPVLLAVWFGWKESEKQKVRDLQAKDQTETPDA